MGLVTDDEDQKEPVQETPVDPIVEMPEDEVYEDNVIDGEKVDFSSLLTFISGQSWTVNYYAQKLGADQVGSTQQVGLEAPVQEYLKIINYELKVQSELSQSQNTDTKEFEMRGTSNLLPGVIANVGDMFTADVGDGRSAILTVIRTRQLTIYRESSYEIEYRVIGFTTKEAMDDLEAKVVETRYFDLEALRNEGEGFKTEEQVNTTIDLNKAIEKLVGRFTRDFYDHENDTYIYRKDSASVYDREVNKFIWLLPVNIEQPNEYVVDVEDGKRYTLWDMLRERVDDRDLVWSALETRMSSLYGQFMEAGSIAWTGIDLVILTKQEPITLVDPIPEEDSIPNVHPSTDDSYVLSPFWYSDVRGMSVLEEALSDWLNHKALQVKTLIELANDVKNWDSRTRYYQIPILLALLISLRQ